MTQEIVFNTSTFNITVGASTINFTVTGTGPPGPTGATGSGYTYEQETPPSSPSDGDTWFVPSSGAVYTYVLSLASWIEHLTTENNSADNITYDNSTSLLAANDVQSAIDELDTVIDAKPNSFLQLPDTPSTYSGQAGLVPRVKSAENGLEFFVVNDNINVTAPSSSSGTLTLDYATSHVFNVTLTESVTTLTISNWVSSGHLGEILLVSTQGGSGSYSYTWPANFKWAGASAPTQSPNVGEIDIYRLITIDGGTTVFAKQLGADMS